MAVFVTGGAGYIGSHTLVELLSAGEDVVVLDNFSNSSIESLKRVQELTGKKIAFYEGDVLDRAILKKIFSQHTIDSVIHFAGLKAVGESVREPLKYYENNVAGSVSLLEEMAKAGVYNFVFSSSATVYGEPHALPIKESFPLQRTASPYGESKLMVENILEDLYKSESRWNVARLRYFNPVGAHESGCIGEDPNDIPNNLLPFIAQVAVGKRETLNIFGNDYPTKDGTGVRDYIHVVDLARGHLKALEKLQSNPGLVTYNLGTGVGYSVLDVMHAFEKACGKSIPHQFVPRRGGDIAKYYGDPTLAERELGWKAEHSLQDMVESSWRWQSQNPNGYRNS